MSAPVPFMSPRLVGDRFDGHAIPLEVLKDLAVLEELVVETAKWCYKQAHPERERILRGFSNGVHLQLTAVTEGSAVPVITLALASATAGLFDDERQPYFESAKTQIIQAVAAAEESGDGAQIASHLPPYILSYFDRLGRSLRPREAMEFNPGQAKPARLTKDSRRRLVLASSASQEITEEVALRGTIPEMDHDKCSFEFQIISGPKIKAPIAAQHRDAILNAFNNYHAGQKILLNGIACFNRTNKLLRVDAIEHVELLDANDIIARIDELRGLKRGWLDGKGLAPSVAGLNWLSQSFEEHYPEELPKPCLYPTPEGGVQIEWRLGGWEISLEVDLAGKSAELHALHMTSDEEASATLDLAVPAGWAALIAQIREKGAQA